MPKVKRPLVYCVSRFALSYVGILKPRRKLLLRPAAFVHRHVSISVINLQK